MVKGNRVKFQPHSLQLQCSRHHLPGEGETGGEGMGACSPLLCVRISSVGWCLKQIKREQGVNDV